MRMGGLVDDLANAVKQVLRPVDPQTGKILPSTTINVESTWEDYVALGLSVAGGMYVGLKVLPAIVDKIKKK